MNRDRIVAWAEAWGAQRATRVHSLPWFHAEHALRACWRAMTEAERVAALRAVSDASEAGRIPPPVRA